LRGHAACMLTSRNRSGIAKCLRSSRSPAINDGVSISYLSHVITIPRSRFRNINCESSKLLSKLLSIITEDQNISRLSSLSVQLYATWLLFLEHPWYQSRFWAVTFVLRPVTCRRSAMLFQETHREVLRLNSINKNSINLGWIAPGLAFGTSADAIGTLFQVSEICNLMLANAMPWSSFLFEVVDRRIFDEMHDVHIIIAPSGVCANKGPPFR